MCCVRLCVVFVVVALSSMRYIFRRLPPFLSSDFVVRFCGQIFVHKALQVHLLSRLQNQHAQACWGLVNTHALA
jgi:hypothetical protein